MSYLSALARAYDRLPDAPPYGFSSEKIGFCISLNEDGTVAHVIDLRDTGGKKAQPRPMLVPQPVKRTAGIAPNTFWDKTSYVLGVTAGEGKRTEAEHAAFVERHRSLLAETDDPGLKAFLRFLESWTPEQFLSLEWPEEMKDQNVIFALEAERLKHIYLHDRPAAKDLWAAAGAAGAGAGQICLVSGKHGPVARLHPSIKGVWGAQSSGAALVSFNLDAFTSYGHDQGDNAPVSEEAAFKYTTALNRFLEKDSGHRLQIGDASTVFWADASDLETAKLAEDWGSLMFGARSSENEKNAEATEERAATKDIRLKLQRMKKGELLAEVEPKLAEGIRFYVLGLSPNAARLSVRFYFEDNFGVLARNYVAYMQDIDFEPWPAGRPTPSIERAVLRIAPARVDASGKLTYDKDRNSAQLSGELLRAIMTGGAFPSSLLSLLILRVRNDGILDSIRIALIKGLIVRSMRLSKRLPQDANGNERKDYLVRTDPDDPNSARRLGRLFAVIERTQLAALGEDVNATVKDKFLAAAAATPQRVFPMLIDNAQHHLKRLRNGHSDASWIKDAQHARRVGAGLDRDIGLLWGSFNDGPPVQHSSEEQGLFLVGYYQERYGGKADPETTDTSLDQTNLSELVEDAE